MKTTLLALLLALAPFARANDVARLEASLLLLETDPASAESAAVLAELRAAGPAPLVEALSRSREIDDEAADPALAAVGRSACLVLSGESDPASLQALSLALADPAAPLSVRAAALAALDARADSRSTLDLAEVLAQDHGAVQDIEYAAEPGAPWRPVRLLLDPELPLKEGAAALLARFAANDSPRIRRRAAAALRTSIEGSSPGGRAAAARALSRTPIHAEECGEALAALRRQWRAESIEDVRIAIAYAFAALGEPADLSLLEEALADRPPLATAASAASEAILARGNGVR